MNVPKILTEQELIAEMYALAITFDDGAMEKTRVRARVMEDIKAAVNLIQDQKKAHADMVIGEDIKEKYSNEPYERIKQHEIKAVNRKLAEQRERNQ